MYFNISVNEIGTYATVNLHHEKQLVIKSKIMANILSTDSLFISATAMGRQFYNYIGTGITSLSDIIDLVRSVPGSPRGMVMLTVRNASQGWSKSSAFYNA